MNLIARIVLVLTSLWVAPCVGLGDLIHVVNSSFEDTTGGIPFNEFTFGAPAGWQIYDPHGIIGAGLGPVFWVGTLEPQPPEFFAVGAPHGSRVAITYATVAGVALGPYGLVQTLGDVLQTNRRYDLSVAIGNIASGTALNGQFFNLDGFPGYRVELMAGDEVLVADQNTLAGSLAEGTFGESLISFQTGAAHPQLGQNLRIRLINLNQFDGGAPAADPEIDFDQVRLSSIPVPEPTSWGALIGLGFLAGYRRRPRK